MQKGPGFLPTREYWLDKVQDDGLSLERVPPRFKDKEMVLAAVTENGFALRYSPEPLKRDREIISAALQENGQALREVPPLLRDDEYVVLEAVQRDGLALRYASPRLKAHHGIVFPALQQNINAFDAISSTEDPAIVLHVLQLDGRFYTRIMSDALQRSPLIGMAAVRQNGLVLQRLPVTLKSNREIVLAALTQNGRALNYVAVPLRGDISLLFLATVHGYEPTPEEYVTGVAYARQLKIIMEDVGRDVPTGAKHARVNACFHSLSKMGPGALRETKTQMAQLLGLNLQAYPHASAFLDKYNRTKETWPPAVRHQVERQLMGREEAERRVAAAETQSGDESACSVMGGKKRKSRTRRRSRRSLL